MDELGRIDGTQDGANLLFQVLGSRYERKSAIITTNLDFENWSVVFMTKNLTAAVLDRLNHRCHLVDANGESYRFKESLRKKTGAKTNTGVNSPPIRTAGSASRRSKSSNGGSAICHHQRSALYAAHIHAGCYTAGWVAPFSAFNLPKTPCL